MKEGLPRISLGTALHWCQYIHILRDSSMQPKPLVVLHPFFIFEL